MENDKRLPEELTPINLKAYFSNNFNACGCSELGEMISSIKSLLEWCLANFSSERKTVKRYDQLYEDLGVYYLLIGLLDDLALVEHGTSIRNSWLTKDGIRLLEAFNKYSCAEIESAAGEAYDGCWYGM